MRILQSPGEPFDCSRTPVVFETIEERVDAIIEEPPPIPDDDGDYDEYHGRRDRFRAAADRLRTLVEQRTR